MGRGSNPEVLHTWLFSDDSWPPITVFWGLWVKNCLNQRRGIPWTPYQVSFSMRRSWLTVSKASRLDGEVGQACMCNWLDVVVAEKVPGCTRPTHTGGWYTSSNWAVQRNRTNLPHKYVRYYYKIITIELTIQPTADQAKFHLSSISVTELSLFGYIIYSPVNPYC